MKTFFYTISFLALLGSPASCSIEEMNNYRQESSQYESNTSTETESDIDPPIMPNKPQ